MWRFGTRVARSAPFLRHASLAADSDYVVHALGEVWSHHFGALHKSTRLELESLILRMCPGVNIDTSDQMNPTIRAADELSCLHAADVAASAIACIPDVPPHLTSRLSLLAAEEGVVFHYDTDTSSALFVQLQGTANPLLGARLTHLATLPAPPAHLIGEVFETLCGCLLLAAPHNGRTECYALHPAGTTSPPPQEVVMSLIHRNGTQLQSSTSRHTLADALAQTPPEVGSEAAGVPLVSMWHPGGLCVVAATTNLSGWVLEAAQRFTALRGAQLMHSRGKRGLMLLVAPAAQDAAHLNNSREDDLLASAGYLVQRGELSAAEGTDPRDAIPPLQPLPHTLGVGVTPLSPPASLESDISFCLYETVLVMLCGSRVAFVGRHLPCADAADTARLSGDGVAAVPPEAWGQAVPRENGGLEDSGESEEVSMDALFTELQVAGDEAQQRVGDAAQEDHDTKLSALQNDADRIRRRLQRVLPEICALRDTLISYCPDTHGSDTLLQAVSDSVSATTDSAADLEFAVPTLRKALSSLEAVARPAATAPLPPDTTADEWTQHLKRGYSEGVRSNVWSELRESPALRDQCVKDIFFEDGLDMECATLMDLDLVCSAVAAQGMYDKTVKVCICDTSYLLLFDLPEDRHVKTVIPFTSLWELANIVRRGSIAGAAERLASVKKRLTSSAFIGNTVLVAPEEEMLLFAEGEASAHSLLSRAPSTRVPDDRILLAARGVHTRIRGMQRQREAARSVSHDVVQVFSEDRELVSRAAVLGLVTSLPPLSDMAASVRREGEGPHDGLDLCPAVSM